MYMYLLASYFYAIPYRYIYIFRVLKRLYYKYKGMNILQYKIHKERFVQHNTFLTLETFLILLAIWRAHIFYAFGIFVVQFTPQIFDRSKYNNFTLPAWNTGSSQRNLNVCLAPTTWASSVCRSWLDKHFLAKLSMHPIPILKALQFKIVSLQHFYEI